MPRLETLLVRRGFGPRARARRLIVRGLVKLEEGTCRDATLAVPDDTVVWVDGERSAPAPRLVSWHKPTGVLTTTRDPWGREGVDAVLPGAWRQVLHPVGRLDQDTSGLLLFSADGQLTQTLLHPKRGVPRTYRATVATVPDGLAARVAAGVQTGEGMVAGQVDAIDGLEVTLTVREGKHRMVRRMLHNAGASVEALHRLSYGPIALGSLAPRALREEDAEAVWTWLTSHAMR